MKRFAIKKLLALLLALSLLLGSVAALAEDAAIQATEDADGNYSVDVGAVDGQSGAGISFEESSLTVDGQPVDPQPGDATKSITIEARDVKEESDGRYVQGVAENAYWFKGDITVNIAGNVDVTSHQTLSDDENDASASARGIEVDTDGGKVDVTAGDVTVSASVTGSASKTEDVYASAEGVHVTGDACGPTTIEVGNVTVSAEIEGDSGEASATGIQGYAEKDRNAEGTTDIVVNGDVKATADAKEGDAYAIKAGGGNEGVVDVTVNGNVVAEGTTSAAGIGGWAGGSTANVTVNGSVTSNSEKGNAGGIAMDVYASTSWTYDEETEEYIRGDLVSGESNVTVNGDVVAESGNRAGGITSVWSGGNANVTVNGSITATSKDNEAIGIDAVSSTYTDWIYNEETDEDVEGEHRNSDVNITVNGDVTAEGKEIASGIALIVDENNTANVAVVGDVSAKGDEGFGLQLTTGKDAQANVLVDGTLSGSTVAIAAQNSSVTDYAEIEDEKYEYDPLAANIYVWKAEENADGAIAGVYDVVDVEKTVEITIINDEGQEEQTTEPEWTTEKTLNEEATAKLEAAIWYIVKVADNWKSALTATGTGTYQAGDTVYDLAHEGEDVKLSVSINEDEEGLDGVYYYDGSDKQTTAEYKQDGENFIVKMLRGGGMLLGLNTHRHEKATREENKVAATCTAAGSYDLVTYCTVCGKVFSTEKKTIAATGHTAGEKVKENEVAPTCTAVGGYDEVVYCTVCKAELSRTHVTLEMLAHTPGEAVKENRVSAQPGKAGHYDKVVYCTACGGELSRETVSIAALPVEEAEPAAMELVYEPADENTEINGVKAADHQPMAEVMQIVGDALDGENVTVEIVDSEKLMDAEEKARFDKLTVKDRLLVVLSALGFGDALGEISGEMSDEAKALTDDIAARVDSLSEEEKQALLDSISGRFEPRTIAIDGVEYESVGVEVVIDRDGEKTYERYIFYKDGDAWKLYGIEVGEYKAVEA